MFWAQKYCLFNRYKRPVPGTDFVNQIVYQIIYFGPLVYTLGSLTWASFRGTYDYSVFPNLISLLVSIIFLIVPFPTILLKAYFSDNFVK